MRTVTLYYISTGTFGKTKNQGSTLNDEQVLSHRYILGGV